MDGKGVACRNWTHRKRFKVDNIPLDCNDFWSEKGFESLSSVGIADQSNDKIVGILAELLNPFQLIHVVRHREMHELRFDLHRGLWMRRSQQSRVSIRIPLGEILRSDACVRTRLETEEVTSTAMFDVMVVGFLMDSKTLHSSMHASLIIVEVGNIFDSVCFGINPASKCCLLIEPLPLEFKACSAVFSNRTSQTADWMVGSGPRSLNKSSFKRSE